MPSLKSGSNPPRAVVFFGSFELDVVNRSLRKDGEFVTLAPKAMELLVLLASAEGRIVDKQEIQDALWPGLAVEEGNLTQTVFLLRKALGETSESPAYLVTVPRRGYRFVLPVSEAGAKKRSWKNPALAAGLLLVILAGAGAYWWRSRPVVVAPPGRLVVLPFANMSPDADTEYFSDGLTEELINARTRVEGLKVVARTTAFQFKGKANDIRQIGKQLNVDAVLEGSVRKQGDRLRITAQLNDTANGYHYWSETFDRNVQDTFAVQEEIANRVAASLSGKGKQARRPHAGTSIEVYNLYLRGLHEQHRVFNGHLERANALFAEAIAKDPLFAPAYAATAEAFVQLAYSSQMEPKAAFVRAKHYWTRALELDPDSAEAYTARAACLLFDDHNLVEAERSFQRAIAINPYYGEAHHWYSHLLVAMGKTEESRRESLRAIEADPLNVSIAAHLAWHYNAVRDFPKAEKAARAALAIDPLHSPAKFFLTETLRETGRFAEGVELDASTQSNPADAERVKSAYRREGELGYWKQLLEFNLNRRKNGAFNAYSIALYSARVGRKDDAFQWLETALKEGDPSLLNIRTDASARSLRDDPRFDSIARRAGLP